MKAISYIILIFIISSCRHQYKGQHDKLNPYYVITSFSNNPKNPKNFLSQKFYNKSDLLLKEIDFFKYCTRYIYNKDNKLIGKIIGRTFKDGYRDIFIFDSSGNHIGDYNTLDKNVDLDTVHFEQIYFYDNKNRLIKEKVDQRIDMEDNTVETWNYYSYIGKKKAFVKTKENGITIWNGTYKYDSKGRLVELKKTLKNRYKIGYFVYDDLGRIIEQGTRSNEKVITPMGTFNFPDKKKVFVYDSTGFLHKEILYENNKVISTIINIKTYIKNNAP